MVAEVLNAPDALIAKKARALRRALDRGRLSQVGATLRALQAAMPKHTPPKYQGLVREALLRREGLRKQVTGHVNTQRGVLRRRAEAREAAAHKRTQDTMPAPAPPTATTPGTEAASE